MAWLARVGPFHRRLKLRRHVCPRRRSAGREESERGDVRLAIRPREPAEEGQNRCGRCQSIPSVQRNRAVPGRSRRSGSALPRFRSLERFTLRRAAVGLDGDALTAGPEISERTGDLLIVVPPRETVLTPHSGWHQTRSPGATHRTEPTMGSYVGQRRADMPGPPRRATTSPGATRGTAAAFPSP